MHGMLDYNNNCYYFQQIYQKGYMRPKSAKSQFQINFETRMTFQRNKQLLDLQKLADQQRQFSALRRKPLKSEDNHVSQKINSSFMNTTAELTERAQRSGTKHKSRVSLQGHTSSVWQQSETNQDNQQRIKNAKRSRSFSIQKMTSRQYHHKLRNKPVNDQRRFNNFQPFSPSAPLYCDYDKMLGKKQEDYSKLITDIQYNTQKLYQQYYYRRTTNNCKVDYKSQRKLKSERYFFIPKRPENIASNDLDPEVIEKGLKIASNLKGVNKSHIDDFYRNSGRQLPSQAEKRQMNQLTNYWKDQTGKIVKKKLDYEARRMKQDLNNERMRKIKYSKEAKHDRKQMCDQKFFRHFKL